jgi:hypothetical protein
MTRIIAALLALSLAGCSTFMRRDPDSRQPSQPPECSDSRIAPSLDAAVALPLTLMGPILGGATLLGIATDSDKCIAGDPEDDGFDMCGGLFPIALIATLLDAAFVYSAVRGYRNVRECQEAKRIHLEWKDRH